MLITGLPMEEERLGTIRTRAVGDDEVREGMTGGEVDLLLPSRLSVALGVGGAGDLSVEGVLLIALGDAGAGPNPISFRARSVAAVNTPCTDAP